ncbi:MAG: branched-chain amino acid ABC transporter permease, partial [Mesorhizobium sp.]
MTQLDYILQQIVNAVSLGSLYALVAVGLSIVFGVLKLTNFAHGDVMMVGAFGVALLAGVGVPFPVAVICGIAAAAVAGFL